MCFLRSISSTFDKLYCNFTVVLVSIPQFWKSSREVAVWTSQRGNNVWNSVQQVSCSSHVSGCHVVGMKMVVLYSRVLGSKMS